MIRAHAVSLGYVLYPTQSPVRVMGPLRLAPEGVVRSSVGTLISIE